MDLKYGIVGKNETEESGAEWKTLFFQCSILGIDSLQQLYRPSFAIIQIYSTVYDKKFLLFGGKISQIYASSRSISEPQYTGANGSCMIVHEIWKTRQLWCSRYTNVLFVDMHYVVEINAPGKEKYYSRLYYAKTFRLHPHNSTMRSQIPVEWTALMQGKILRNGPDFTARVLMMKLQAMISDSKDKYIFSDNLEKKQVL